jgi:hypothetical protein
MSNDGIVSQDDFVFFNWVSFFGRRIAYV